MKHLNFLSNLLSLSLGSPCTDVSLDRRLTVGSPSGRYCSGLLRLVSVLAILLTVGVGNVWGTTVKYAQTSTSAASVSSGTAPTGSSVSFSNTYGTKEQLTNGNNMVLTLTSLGGISISNITLSMKSNKSGGAGKLSYSTNGGSTWTYLVGGTSSAVQFNNAAWHGSYSTSYVNISKTVSLTNVTQLKIKIEATANSLYCQSFQLTYTAAASCSNSVAVTKGSESHGEVTTIGSASVATCSSTESDRRVTITITPDDCYDAPSTLTWTKSSGTVSASKQSGPTDNGDGTYSYVYQFAQNDNGAGTFGVTCTAKAAGYTVNFDAGPGVSASSSLTETCSGSGVTLPTVTATGVCKGWTTFAGWATAPVTDSTTTSGVTLYAAGSTYVPASNNMTLYAVYSKVKGGGTTTLFSEDFAALTAGNDASTSGPSSSATSTSTLTQFSSMSNVYPAGGTAKLGGGSSVGYLVTNAITASIGDVLTISFKVKGWTTVEGNIQVESNNSSFTKPSASTYTATISDGYQSKSVTVTLTKANPTIKIGTTAKRAFIDDLTVTKGSSTTYYCSDPNCCTSLGSINGSFF